jgi:hypothetical protein
MTPCAWLTILGGLLEISGLGLVAREITRLQRQEFGQPVWLSNTIEWTRRDLGRLRAIFRGLLRRQPEPITPQPANLRGTSSASSSASGTLTVGAPASPTTEQRLTRLEGAVSKLTDRVQGVAREMDQQRRATQAELGDIRTDVVQLEKSIAAERRKAARREIRVQTVGTVLFVSGVLLSVLGSALTC